MSSQEPSALWAFVQTLDHWLRPPQALLAFPSAGTAPPLPQVLQLSWIAAQCWYSGQLSVADDVYSGYTSSLSNLGFIWNQISAIRPYTFNCPEPAFPWKPWTAVYGSASSQEHPLEHLVSK